jgi:acetyltransferase-like isoleucine patch superfamily enzyme
MNATFKRKIINHPLLYKLIVNLVNARYFFANTSKIKGRNNRIEFKEGVQKKKVQIKIIGNNNSVTIHSNCRLKNTKIIILGSNNCLTFGEKVMVYESASFELEGSNTLVNIGKNTTIGSAKFKMGESNTSIIIGIDCMLSRDIVISTSDYHSVICTITNNRINPPKNIEIKRHVWVGNGAFISKGAIIGNNCVVASRAYVGGKNFEDHTIIGGLPAKQLRKNIDWSREKLSYKIE